MLLNPNMNTGLMLNDLAPRRAGRVDVERQQAPSYAMLTLVVAVHLFGFAWLINHKVVQPVVKEPMPPMMVSLVASVAEKMEAAPKVPAPQQPVVKKQQKIVNTNTPVSEPATVESVRQEALVADNAPQITAEVARAPDIIEAVKPKVEAEQAIESPRFGAAYLNNPAPEYPQLSRRFSEQGRVLLRVLVSINGNADQVQVESGSGFVRLDQAAVQAVKGWRFIPAKKSNQPISAYVLVPVKFSLDS